MNQSFKDVVKFTGLLSELICFKCFLKTGKDEGSNQVTLFVEC